MLNGQSFTIIGGGIGGFAAATALAMRGTEVRVLEQAPAITEVGAGLQVSPNGLAVLDRLGLGTEARKRAVRNRAVRLVDGLTGRTVIRMDLAHRRPAQTFLLFHRADLLDLLREAAEKAGVEVETGAKVVAVTPHDDHATLEISGQAPRDVSFAIGADGLHSVLRPVLNGDRAPFFTGQVAWRALVPDDRSIAAEATVRMGPGRHMVTYPLREGSLINIVAVEERREWAEEGWFNRDDPANLRAAFSGFAADAQALLERVEEVHIWGLFRHPVADVWHRKRTALVGDAAHPTLPFLAQGGVMALEDAWVLADCLDKEGLETGPALYQARRRHRVSRAIEAANKNARNYHHANPLLRIVGFNALRVANTVLPESILSSYDWLYDHDVTLE